MNSIKRVCFVVLLFITQFNDVTSHGGLLEPPMRSIAWRYGFDAPVNYDWMALYCGGLHTIRRNGGKCGLCGDPYQGPYENDQGGVYDTGTIVRHYPIGLGEIEVKVELTAHHKGFFQFKLCPNNDNALTKDCLNRYPLQIREGQTQGDPYRYYPATNPKLYELHVELPQGVTCDRCVLQWTYTAGNSAGSGPNGRSCLGCGIQETFVNCADISIGGTRDRIQVARGTGNSTRAGQDIILPARNDIVDIIRNAPAESSLQDFFRDIGHAPAPTQQPPRRRVDSVTPSRMPINDWEFDRNAAMQDFGTPQTDFGTQRRMTNTWDAPSSQSSFGSQGAHPDTQMHNGWESQRTIPPPSGIDHRFDSPSQTQFHSERTIPSSNRLDFSGPSNPTILRALNTHFRQSSVSHGDGMSEHPVHRSRDSLNDPQGTQSSAHMSGSRLHSFESVNQRSRLTNEQTISGQDHHSSLLGSINPIISEISRHHRDRIPTSFTSSRHSSLNNRVLASDHHALGRDTFGSPTHGVFPTHRSMQSQARSAHAPAHSFISSDPHSRSIHHSSAHQTGVHRFQHHDSTVQSHESPVHRPVHHHQPLPRRIVVQSMEAAQQLLRRYPQLRGRVFLSSHAHRSNTYAHSVSKYRHRSRW